MNSPNVLREMINQTKHSQTDGWVVEIQTSNTIEYFNVNNITLTDSHIEVSLNESEIKYIPLENITTGKVRWFQYGSVVQVIAQ